MLAERLTRLRKSYIRYEQHSYWYGNVDYLEKDSWIRVRYDEEEVRSFYLEYQRYAKTTSPQGERL